MNRKTVALLTAAILCASAGGCGAIPKQSAKTASLKIGISVYDQYDTFVSEVISHLKSYAKEKEQEWNITITLEVQDAHNVQLTQNDQMDDFIKRGFDIACINLVDRTDASSIIEKAKTANVPVIFFNRELVKEDLQRWDQLYYVGADAFESGILQGEILAEACGKDFSSIDRNGDGIIQYVMLEGEAGHQDSIVRTLYVINTIKEKGYQVEKLGDEIANWNRAQAETKMNQFLKSFGDEIEVVLTNNDDMALGAIDSLKKFRGSQKQAKAEGSPWPAVIGIDGTKVGLEALQNRELLGTVLNDAKGQGEGMLELARSVVMGTELPEDIELLDGKYIRLPYQKVTAENVDEVMWDIQIEN
ncbi:MAG: galactose ABC transporter substrate-binding protein [Lachnospiraceae bacterium]|nr:galactose ABC transporter substrate-binding protein [Lachnospiraceae bacterium]